MHVALQRLWIQLTADRKRFGVLCAVLGLGLLLWARIILTSNVPRTAVARDEAMVAKAERETKSKMSNLNQRERVQGRVPVDLDRTPRRDPFVISTVHFPKDAAEGVGSPDQAKSEQQDADDAEKAADRKLASLRTLIERFRLEAAMSGAGIGVISGHTLRLGEFVPAVGNPEVEFELIEVKQRSVLLRFEDLVFELHMTSPGR